jgi:ADP-ribosyl-[dinitrogen reductase] hydrolase
MKTATPADGNTRPLPSAHVTIRLGRRFSDAEVARLRLGCIPEEMEDKWFLYWKDDALYFHRSWTGFCIYVARFRREADGWRMIEADLNRDPEQYLGRDEATDATMVSQLIDVLLLDRRAAPAGGVAPPDAARGASEAEKDRARGVLLGQLTGDALGTTVEFAASRSIAGTFPGGLRDIVGGGPFKVLPGQVTDDSELALALARCLLAFGWDLDARARAYAAWYDSEPFDIGGQTAAAFGHWQGRATASAMFRRAREANGDPSRQANGALMRVSPLAIHGSGADRAWLIERAREDARLSHPSAVCQEANAAYVAAIQAGLLGGSPKDALAAARAATDDAAIQAALSSIDRQPECDGRGQGWVILALRNAFHMLVHEGSFEEALVRTVMAGGDADTNGCITGALLGAFHGMRAIPARWIATVLACRTSRGATYQAADAVALAYALLEQRQATPSDVSNATD